MGIFSIFSKKKPLFEDYSALGADLHSHLIPGIDDGSKSVDESLALIDQLREIGFSKIITTPHVMYDGYKNSPEIINNGLKEVQEGLQKYNLNVPIEAAAEYMLDDGLEQKIEQQQILLIKGKYMLFELSYMNKPATLESIIFKIKSAGWQPILAHPERYPYLYSDKLEKYRAIKDLGVHFQLNIPSFAGAYGSDAKEFAEKLAAAEMVEFVATDLHNEHHLMHLENARKEKSLFNLIQSGRLLNNQLI